MANLKFFTFHQNNSGGWFDNNGGLAPTVIIEAKDASDANAKALDLGMYWDGATKGIDCDQE